MIFQTGLMPPAVDMGIVGHALYFPQLPLKETALEGVHHLLPGFAVTFENGEATEHQYWCPWDYIAPSAASRTMVEGLREVVRSTHRAWGRCFKNVVVGLSGGLDSSIVEIGRAACWERVCQYVESSVGAGSLTKKK